MDHVALIAQAHRRVWSMALQNRMHVGDFMGAQSLLELVKSFDETNASYEVWTDLLFILARSGHHTSEQVADPIAMMEALREQYGMAFVERSVVPLINGCVKVNMFGTATQALWYLVEHGEAREVKIPAKILGNCVSQMVKSGDAEAAVRFVEKLLKSQRIRYDQIQPQFFMSVFQAMGQADYRPHGLVVGELEKWAWHLVKSSNDRAVDLPNFTRVFGAAIQCCVGTAAPSRALQCYDTLLKLQELDRRIHVDENVYVNIMKACLMQRDESLFKDVYRSMAQNEVARDAGFGSAIRFCHTRHDIEFLHEVLDDVVAMERACVGGWTMPLLLYNDALGAFAETDDYESAQDLFHHMVGHAHVDPDEITMLEMVESHRKAPLSQVFDLMEQFLEWHLVPTVQVFTSLLSICARNESIVDARGLLVAMEQQGVQADVKMMTVIAFIYGSHGDIPSLLGILEEMEQLEMAADAQFYEQMLQAVYRGRGIDMCFALLVEIQQRGLKVSKHLYDALIDIGTRNGLIERTLNVAFQMECEGYTIDSKQLGALIARCGSITEANEMFRTVLLLHQSHGGDSREPFDANVYHDLVRLLERFKLKNAMAKVDALAASMQRSHVSH